MHIHILLYPGFTALDAIGPYEVLHNLPGAELRFIGSEPGPITADSGALTLQTAGTLADTEPADLLLIPGGKGTGRYLREHADDLPRIAEATAAATTVASVCTGSLILAAADLLNGQPATTHWARLDQLEALGARPVKQRWVRSGKFITAAGVSAGIDMALALAAELSNETVARSIQLGIEYDPQPPFDSGNADTADPTLVQTLKTVMRNRRD